MQSCDNDEESDGNFPASRVYKGKNLILRFFVLDSVAKTAFSINFPVLTF